MRGRMATGFERRPVCHVYLPSRMGGDRATPGKLADARKGVVVPRCAGAYLEGVLHRARVLPVAGIQCRRECELIQMMCCNGRKPDRLDCRDVRELISTASCVVREFVQSPGYSSAVNVSLLGCVPRRPRTCSVALPRCAGAYPQFVTSTASVSDIALTLLTVQLRGAVWRRRSLDMC